MNTRNKTKKVKQVPLGEDRKSRRDASTTRLGNVEKKSPRFGEVSNSDFSESEDDLIESMPLSPHPFHLEMESVNALLSLSIPPKELSYEQKVLNRTKSKEIKANLESKKRKITNFEQNPPKKKQTKIIDHPPLLYEEFDRTFLQGLKVQGDYESIPAPPHDIPKSFKNKPEKLILEKPREKIKQKKDKRPEPQFLPKAPPLPPPKGRFMPLNIVRFIDNTIKRQKSDEKARLAKLQQRQAQIQQQKVTNTIGSAPKPITSMNPIQYGSSEKTPRPNLQQAPKQTPQTYSGINPPQQSMVYRTPPPPPVPQYNRPQMMQPGMQSYGVKQTYQTPMQTPVYYTAPMSPFGVPFGVVATTQYGPPQQRQPGMYRAYDPYQQSTPQYGMVRQYGMPTVQVMQPPYGMPPQRK